MAVRPLEVKELAEVLAITFSEADGVPTVNENLRWEDQEQAVLSACSSLVTIVEDGAGIYPVVQFSHFSVKEFLTSDRLATSNLDACRCHHIRPEPAHTIMVQACLGTLLQFEDSIYGENLRTLPLAYYAAFYFDNHAGFGNVLSHVQDGIDNLLDTNKPHFVAFLKASGKLDWDESPPGVPLYCMAKFGFFSLVRYLILMCPGDVMVVNNDLGTPLHGAVWRGRMDISELLLGLCEDVDVRCSNGRTPLHLAVYNRHFEIAQMLIGRNANIYAQDNDGQTPLHGIIDHLGDIYDDNFFDLLRSLLEHGADKNSQDSDHLTSSQMASSWRSCRSVLLLLEYGANGHLRGKNGEATLQGIQRWKARRYSPSEYVDIIQSLLKQVVDVNLLDDDCMTLLHLASYEGFLETTNMLLEYGATVNVRNNDGRTPLHCALARCARSQAVNVARLLLGQGADAETRDINGSTALHLSSSMGSLEATMLLLEHGVTVDVRNSNAQTPLHCALAPWGGSVDVTRMLLEHGADVNCQDNDGSSPLHLSCYKSSLEDTRLLLEHGAKIHAQDNDGKTPLQIASARGHQEIIRLLSKDAQRE